MPSLSRHHSREQHASVKVRVAPAYDVAHDALHDAYYGPHDPDAVAGNGGVKNRMTRRGGWAKGQSSPVSIAGQMFDCPPEALGQENHSSAKALFDELHGDLAKTLQIAVVEQNEHDGRPYGDLTKKWRRVNKSETTLPNGRRRVMIEEEEVDARDLITNHDFSDICPSEIRAAVKSRLDANRPSRNRSRRG